jgi:hypothetical protein
MVYVRRLSDGLQKCSRILYKYLIISSRDSVGSISSMMADVNIYVAMGRSHDIASEFLSDMSFSKSVFAFSSMSNNVNFGAVMPPPTLSGTF